MKRILILISILFMEFFLSSSNLLISPERDELKKIEISERNREAQDHLAGILSTKGNLDSSLAMCRKIYDYAVAQEDIQLIFIVSSYTAQTFMMKDEYDSAYVYLSRSFSIWEKYGEKLQLDNRRSLYIMLNSMAIYSSNVDMDYEKATEYLLQGLKIARANPEDSDYAVMGKNLVTIFFIRQNPVGLRYAQEIYQDGRSRENKFLTYIGAYGTAQMFCLKKEYDSAFRYVREASGMLRDVKHTISMCNLYGDVFSGKNQPDSAEYYYKQAIRLVPGASVTDISYLCLSYGAFLRKQGFLHQSEQILLRGLDSAQANKSRIFMYRLYEEISKVYSDMGENDLSLNYYKMYLSESDSIFNIKRERAINELTSKYEYERHRNELGRHQMMYLKQSHRMQILILAFVLVAIILLVLFVMYRNINSMYTRIVKQYRDAIESEKKMAGQISELQKKLENPLSEGSEEKQENLENETAAKDDELFSRLDSAMRNDFLYRDGTLTREKAAELIGTNRTYLSREVSEKTGMPFNQYVNSFRIKEALTILSDSKDNTPLKAISAEIGFNSLTTFYKVFKDEVGMTPAKYRLKIQELSQK